MLLRSRNIKSIHVFFFCIFEYTLAQSLSRIPWTELKIYLCIPTIKDMNSDFTIIVSKNMKSMMTKSLQVTKCKTQSTVKRVLTIDKAHLGQRLNDITLFKMDFFSPEISNWNRYDHILMGNLFTTYT